MGQPVTWVNEDDSPHQVTIVSTKERSPTPGTFDYACGLHPQMKGTVEVK